MQRFLARDQRNSVLIFRYFELAHVDHLIWPTVVGTILGVAKKLGVRPRMVREALGGAVPGSNRLLCCGQQPGAEAAVDWQNSYSRRISSKSSTLALQRGRRSRNGRGRGSRR
jgi:hypothetical protein